MAGVPLPVVRHGNDTWLSLHPWTMTLHRTLAAALLLAAPSVAPAQTALTANTNFFVVDSFYYPGSSGRWNLYRAAGFYERSTGAVPPKLSLLPRVTINAAGIRYIDSTGAPVTPGGGTWAASVTHVNIPLLYSGSLPAPAQALAIAGQTGGTPQPAFITPPATDASGNFVIYPPATTNPQIFQLVLAGYNRYGQQYQAQGANLTRWQSYQSRATDINELGLKVIVAGETVAERYIPAYTIPVGGQLPMLTVPAPSASVVRQISQGDFEVAVSFRFRDANIGTINAAFDVEEILTDYLRESQRAVTSSRSSGMQIFHIGSRKTKVKQSMDVQIERNTTNRREANTTIVMEDASDAQVANFDAIFFPSLSQQEVIRGHLAAADSATRAGNLNLAAAHQQYAQALQQGAPMAEVDAVGAAAALNANDWATFVAKGVRFMDTKTSNTGTFVRVARENVTTSQATRYTNVNSRSVQRAVTLVIRPEEPVQHSAELGICDAAASNGNTGLLVTCVRAGSPAFLGGIAGGHIIYSVDGSTVNTPADLFQVLDTKSPGDRITLTLAGPSMGSTFTRTFTLGYGPPR